MARAKYRNYDGPTAYIAQDATGKTIELGWIGSWDETWKFAEDLLAENKQVVRIALFDDHLLWFNAISKPGHMRHDEDIMSQSDQQDLEKMRLT